MHVLGRWFFLGLGLLSVALGVVGIFVPVLPTTPFLLLAAFCFARSSDRFLQWLLGHRWLGAYLRNYREQKGMAANDKILTILALWLGIGLSGYFAIPAVAGRTALVLIAAAVTFHLTRIKTLRPPTHGEVQPRLGEPLPIDRE